MVSRSGRETFRDFVNPQKMSLTIRKFYACSETNRSSTLYPPVQSGAHNQYSRNSPYAYFSTADISLGSSVRRNRSHSNGRETAVYGRNPALFWGSFGVVLLSKANFQVVRSALQNSTRLLCMFLLIRSSLDPTFYGIFRRWPWGGWQTLS